MDMRIGSPCKVCEPGKKKGFYCPHIKNDFTSEECAKLAIDGFSELIAFKPQDQAVGVISVFDTLENARNSRQVFEETVPESWKPIHVMDDTKVIFTVQGRTQPCTWTIQIDEL